MLFIMLLLSVEKEQFVNVKKDRELHVLKNMHTIVKEVQTTIVEKDLILRVKGNATSYIEKDKHEKYLKNLFTQVGADLGIEVTSAYHINAKSIKQSASKIELNAKSGITLRCKGHALTVDASGIHLYGGSIDNNTGNGGITAQAVTQPEIQKPLYNKLRVTGLKVAVKKQDKLDQELTYTAVVEKYEDGAWTQTTELNETQKAQINWYFIKNNDPQNKEITSENPTNDTISINGLEMRVSLEDENIYKYGHAHAFVTDAEKEGYGVSELKRQIEVVNVIALDEKTSKVECSAELNVDNISETEKAQIRWSINNKEKPEFNGKIKISYNTKDEKTRDVPFKAYIEGRAEDGAEIVVSHDVQGKESSTGDVGNNNKFILFFVGFTYF